MAYKPFTGKFIVGTPFIYGWDFCWKVEDENGKDYPDVFDTRQEAEEEIKQDIADIAEAISREDMFEDSRTTRDDYIIALADMDEGGNVKVYNAETTDEITDSFNIKNY